MVACSDLLLERAEAQAEAYGVAKACTPEELLADEEVEIVLNLTVPVVHAEVSMAALEAGKHVYTEKPLAVSLKDGRRMMALAPREVSGSAARRIPFSVGGSRPAAR